MSSNLYQRPQAAILAARLAEPRRFIQVIAGPRQVGKTTLVRQVLSRLSSPSTYASADEPTLRGPAWIEQQWEAARLSAPQEGPALLLVLDSPTPLVVCRDAGRWPTTSISCTQRAW